MTHIGPFSSESAIDTGHLGDGCNIHSGSKTLDELFEKNKDFILMNVHGHNHDSKKSCKVSGVPIFNPNALFMKCYSEYTLKKNKDSGRWEVDAAEFLEI